MTPRLRAVLASLALLGLATTVAAPADALTDAGTIKLHWTARGPSFSQPDGVTSARDGSGRLFVIEQTGRVRVFKPGASTAGTYLDLRSQVATSDERGLLGLVFSPNFKNDHWLWVAYTISSGALRVQRFRAASAGASSVSTSTARLMLDIPHPNYANHNAGQLAFGRDGLLYIGTGDGGGGGDPAGNALNLRSRSGKILRIDALHACGNLAYCIPKTNPWATSSTIKHEIWGYGARNPWRFSFDRANGTMWIGDVGQDSQEEIDVIPYRYAYGVNLRWSCNEGRLVYNSSRCSSWAAKYHPYSPRITYSHRSGYPCGGAVIGGYVYRGTAYSYLAGLYLYGDYCFSATYLWDGHKSVKAGGIDGVSGFGESDKGEIWAVSVNTGRLYQMSASRV